jgi:hypothetical protein
LPVVPTPFLKVRVNLCDKVLTPTHADNTEIAVRMFFHIPLHPKIFYFNKNIIPAIRVVVKAEKPIFRIFVRVNRKSCRTAGTRLAYRAYTDSISRKEDPDMPSSSTVPFTELGTLLVRISTAGFAIPVSDADIRIHGAEEGNQSVYFLPTSDRSGLSESISLPAPPAAVSLSPSPVKGFADYDVEVFKEGFYPVILRAVPIFSGVTAVQNVRLIPWPSYDKNAYPPAEEIDFTESEPLYREEVR